jgi:hypothetical protein
MLGLDPTTLAQRQTLNAAKAPIDEFAIALGSLLEVDAPDIPSLVGLNPRVCDRRHSAGALAWFTVSRNCRSRS